MQKQAKISTLRIAIILDSRRQLTNGNFPLKIRITKGKEQSYFKTALETTPEIFERAFLPKPRNEAKTLYEEIDAIKNVATNVCNSLPTFSADAFRREFYKEGTSKRSDDVFVAFQNYSKQLFEENRIGTAKSYDGAARSFAAFCSGKLSDHKQSKATGKKKPAVKFPKLKFQDITVQWLKRYATAMEENGASRSTVGIYIRSLRSIYNIAIVNDPSLQAIYPFGKGGFSIPTSTKNKRPLPKVAIRSILDYDAKNDQEELARNIWVFSYLMNGANIADLVKLKYEQITETETGISINFEREKTKRKADQTIVKVNLPANATPLFRRIIDLHGNKSNSGYVFPFLKESMTAEEQWKMKSQLIRRVNLGLRKIGEELNIPLNLTTYTARHSFATILMHSGAPIAYISQSLGHSDLKTTETYLGSFDDEHAREFTANLLNF
jgi:integrase/recombinase XerD